MIAPTDKIQVDLMVRVLAYHIRLGHPVGFDPERFSEWEQHVLFQIFQAAAEQAVGLQRDTQLN